MSTPIKKVRLNKNAKQWIEALRSGKYKQGLRALRNKNKFCCLGVACDLYRKVHPEAKWHKSGEHWIFLGRYQDYLPSEVQTWLGFNNSQGLFTDENNNKESLAELNDAEKSFNEIADVIESRPKGLFKKRT